MNLFSDNIQLDDLAVATRLFRESREGFIKLFNNSPICMSMTSTNLGKRVYAKVNKKFLATFGFSEEEILGRTSVEIGILDQEESLRVGAIIQEKGRLQNDYVKCITKTGKIVHTISSIEMMDMDNDIYLVSFFVDITQIMEQQVIIERHMQQLEAINKELEAFSYTVSHDLRAPLRAIDNYTRALEEDYNNLFDDDGKKMLSSVKRNAKKMSNLIDDLLTFAKMGNLGMHKTVIDMNELVQEVLMDLKKESTYTAEIKMGTLHTLQGDAVLMKQVLINLLSNGLKYSSKKDTPVVEITSEIKDNQVVYTIKDNGEGFDMKFADKLFVVFQRLHNSQEFEGTGVGLATVKRIINQHGGTIWAEAEIGKGAAFSFALPIYY